jgi:hypothetical protein
VRVVFMSMLVPEDPSANVAQHTHPSGAYSEPVTQSDAIGWKQAHRNVIGLPKCMGCRTWLYGIKARRRWRRARPVRWRRGPHPSRLGRLPLRSRRPACAAQPTRTRWERRHRRHSVAPSAFIV